MSTNFYMMTTNKELVEKHFPYEYSIVDSPYFGYEIHIGKRSCGWKPVFAEHRRAYSSVKEMLQFLQDNQNDIRIFDEYEREYDLAGLNDELILWGDIQERRITYYDDRIGDIEIPIDHMEMNRRQIKNGTLSSMYYRKDEDGFDFMEGDFC